MLCLCVPDKHWLDSLTADSLPSDGPNLRFSPQNRPVSFTAASLDPESTAVTQSSDGQPQEPTLNSGSDAADRALSHWGLSPSQNPKAFTSSDPLAEQTLTRTTPALRSLTPGSGPDFEGPSSRRARDLLKKRSIVTISKQPPQSNSTPSAPLGPQLVHLYSDQKNVDESPPTQNQSKAPLNSRERDTETLAPSYLPFFSPHPTAALSEPTEALPVDIFPTNTMDKDWGSGEYMETMSFLGSEGDDYALVSNLPSDMYDLEESASESYDTSFPTRVGVTMSSFLPHFVSPSLSLSPPLTSAGTPTSVYPPPLSSSVHPAFEPTPPVESDVTRSLDEDWSEAFTIQATDLLLPDMNSIEYYTTQLTKENTSLNTGAELRGNGTISGLVSKMSISTTHLVPTRTFTVDPSHMHTSLFGDDGPTDESAWAEEESSGPYAGYEPLNDTSPVNDTALGLQPVSMSDASTAPTPAASAAPAPDDTPAPDETPAPGEATPSTTVSATPNATVQPSSMEPSPDDTSPPPIMIADEGVSGEPTEGHPVTPTASAEDNTTSLMLPVTTTAAATTPHITTSIPTTGQPEAVTTLSTTTVTTGKSPATTPQARQYLCSIDNPAYAVRVGFPSGATVGYAKTQIRDILKSEFNKPVELQVLVPPPKFVFRVVSGPVVYTAIAVTNALRRSGRRFLSVAPGWTQPDNKYLAHSVLQFVPGNVDVRACNFSERIEKGLTLALAEVRRRAQESTNFTVHVILFGPLLNRVISTVFQIVNITMAGPGRQQQPVNIFFAVRGSGGYLLGSEVTNLLLRLTMVEFSYYMGFPVLEIAEPFHYAELNTTQLLRSSWLRTVLLGVLDPRVGDPGFQAKIERQLAQLLGEAMGTVRRAKRATTVGNSSVQVVSLSELTGADHPLEIVYFVEGPSGQRVPAVQSAELLNSLDVQRAAIVLGHRVQGILAQPVEKVASQPPDAENTVLWIVIGVVVPLLVVIVIVSILYWKLCRTDKLEFQPDAMTSIQQRQKLPAPTVKGFDFAKLHLGQHGKDDLMVVQEPEPQGPHPAPGKEGLYPPENREIPVPTSKTSVSSVKASLSGRRRISPSDGDSVVSDGSSGRDSGEDPRRGQVTPSDSKQARKTPISVANGPPPMNGSEQLSSTASIFEHVDRMSRSMEASRRLPNKIQLIAMQPMAVPPLLRPSVNGKIPVNPHMNKEMQVALRHKSEIEHHRNKIRLRAKRKGHYDFPAMENTPSNGFGDTKDPGRIYQKARQQIDRILDPELHIPSLFTESKKGARGRRSPRQRRKDQLSAGLADADRDHLITSDSDAVYRRGPGVSNVAFVSDPDQGSPARSPSPSDDVFLGPSSPPPGHAPAPPPYAPPQPSIEEARQQMHSLLDDAFALVSPTSQGSAPGVTLPGGGGGPHHPPGPPTPVSPPSPDPSLCSRQGLGSSFLPPGEAPGAGPPLQPDSLYPSKGHYAEEQPLSARPRPVGGTAGSQLHHLTQVGLSSRISRGPLQFLVHPDQSLNITCVFPQMPRNGIREPSAPPAHQNTPGLGYPSAPEPLDAGPPTHSSASLIKAIREELLRLSQKQAAVSSYHS
uniref:Si:ch211-1e14.1 n=1 Tax=Gadus morhua TaxID=8049 RepID=A0A8C4Z1K5_GADMO